MKAAQAKQEQMAYAMSSDPTGPGGMHPLQ